MKRSLLAVSVLALTASLGAPKAARACEECRMRKAGTYLGQFTLLGNGTVRTWVKLDKQRKPESLGITFSESALTGLSETGMGPKEMPMVFYTLALPKEAKAAGIDHVGLDWAPKGHIPNGVYNVPHFDVHFYMMPPEQLAQITATGKDLARCAKKPLAKYFPEGYVLPPGTEVPRMGAHAVDAQSPELNGKPFTHTFLYGYYDGSLNFVEPMITKAFLETKPNVVAPVKLPKAYARSGYYPTRYRIAHDPVRQEYTVALEGLTFRPGDAKTAPKVGAKKLQVRR